MTRVSKKTGVNWSTRSRLPKPSNMPDVGSYVWAQLKDLEISVSTLAARMRISINTAYALLKKRDWRVSEIMNAGSIIGINLFAWYARETGEPDPAIVLQQQLTEARTELEKLRIENASLKESLRLLGGGKG